MEEIVEYDITEAAIAEMGEKYLPLVITDLGDKEQLDVVHNARMIVKGKRVEVEKKRKELKADALEWGRKVDTEAKRIFGMLEPIEEHLKTEEDKVLLERKRIEEEAARIEKEKVQGRVDALGEYRHMMPFMEVATMTDEEFTAKLAEAKATYEAEAKRLDDEQKAREEEEARIATERAEIAKIWAEQEAKGKVQEAKEKAIEAEHQKLEAEKKAEADRKAKEVFEKQAKEDAKIQAEKDLAEKVKREAEETKKKEAEEKAEIARQEELKPDKEKLIAWAKSLKEIMIPPLADEDAQTIAVSALGDIYRIAESVEQQAEELK